jgi:hypothetical protein
MAKCVALGILLERSGTDPAFTIGWLTAPVKPKLRRNNFSNDNLRITNFHSPFAISSHGQIKPNLPNSEVLQYRW